LVVSPGITWADPRKEEGELLFPQFYNAAVIAQAKLDLGDSYSAQHQQRPAPATGSIFKKHWWRFYKYFDSKDLPPVRMKNEEGKEVECPVVILPDHGDDFQSWDAAFKGTSTSDFVCGGAIRRCGPNYFLLDMKKQKLDFPQTCEAIVGMSAAWPSTIAKLIEEKANGAAVIAQLRDRVSGLIPINPKDGKVQRAHAAAPLMKAGNVYLPHPSLAPWVLEFIESFAMFPNGLHDDDVDMLTQALNFRKRGVFDVDKRLVVVNPFGLDMKWHRGVGIYIGPKATGAVWLAKDPLTSRFYVYDEYYRVGADWTLHASHIKAKSANLQAFMDSPREPDLPMYVIAYRNQGMPVWPFHQEVDPLTAQLQSAFSDGSLKIFSPLMRLVEETELMMRAEGNGKIQNIEEWVVQGALRAVWGGKDRLAAPLVKRTPPATSFGGGMGWAR
jgi:predicted phage terminase large subunit-like protein